MESQLQRVRRQQQEHSQQQVPLTEQQLRDKATQDTYIRQQHFEWLQNPHTKIVLEALSEDYSRTVEVISKQALQGKPEEVIRFGLGMCFAQDSLIKYLLTADNFIPKQPTQAKATNT